MSRSGADLQNMIGHVAAVRVIARIHHDHLRVALALGFHRPLKTAGMIFGRIATHDQHHVGVLDVDPAIGHGPSSERWPQTGDRGAVSNPGLIFYERHSQAAHGLDSQEIEFVGVGAAAVPGDGLQRDSRCGLPRRWSMNVSSRVFLMWRAISFKAWSHAMSSQ